MLIVIDLQRDAKKLIIERAARMEKQQVNTFSAVWYLR